MAEHPVDDQEAVARFVRTGESRWFEILVQRHQPRVYRIALSILGPGGESEAEEVAQEAFLTVFRRIRQFRMDSSFYTWLYRVAYNLAIDRRRLARRRLPHLGDEALRHMADERRTVDPADCLREKQQRREVRRSLEELPDLYRCVLHMSYWMDCPLEEIGEAIGAPVNTVKSYLHRARRRLMLVLKRKGVDDLHGLL